MIDRYITRLAGWLSLPIGFLSTCFVVAAGLGLGFILSFNDHWALVFNLFLSIAALVIAGLILVAGAKDTSALHAKLDELIRSADKADDRLIGIDLKSAEELDSARSAEQAAARASERIKGLAESEGRGPKSPRSDDPVAPIDSGRPRRRAQADSSAKPVMTDRTP